ncbi:MAG: ATP-dependent DNA helicase RecG [Eubacterium sp.]|nr:ATP-dependent DNA helicase RecG [Eubacterium sp.]
MISLNSDIKYIKGVGEKRAELFNKLGIYDVRQLINFYPRKYEDLSNLTTVKESESGETVCIRATLMTPVREHMIRKGMTVFKCNFTDGETVIHVTLFNNKYLAKALRQYNDYILYGKIEKNLTSAEMSSPSIEDAEKCAGIRPIYHATDKLNSKAIGKVIKTALEALPPLNETLDTAFRLKYALVPRDFAIRQIHSPDSFESLEKARYRLIFEELLILQLGLIKLKSKKKAETGVAVTADHTEEYYKLLPFTPTNAQKRAIADCLNDMQGEYAMNRLIQGDVGSGKTAVGAGVIYSAVKNGFQCALMAPTEILATQHMETLSKILAPAGFRIDLLTGSTPAKEKREIKKRLMEGETDLVIGTHALIQSDVEFKNLGLVITDEQHRFGVDQRANLAMKGKEPHTLVMSATPIPRTLALMIYGDLDISVLDELPAGRQKIRTDVVNSSYHKRIYEFVKKAIARGEQAYIVCPLVEEGENDLLPATQYAEKLSETAFKGYNLGLLHGKMKAKDKDKVMSAFANGDIKILISTTVIEVGVDVPNATVMVIENAERFGLSQLHQLRGRVGRGAAQSYCILVSDSKGDTAQNRLAIMKKYSDGFIIADEDLKQRGPGDFFGNRQHGLPEMKIADLLSDTQTLTLCRKAADEILAEDYNLDLPKNRSLAEEISDMFRNSVSN